MRMRMTSRMRCEADEADEDVRIIRIRRMNRTPNEPL